MAEEPHVLDLGGVRGAEEAAGDVVGGRDQGGDFDEGLGGDEALDAAVDEVGVVRRSVERPDLAEGLGSGLGRGVVGIGRGFGFGFGLGSGEVEGVVLAAEALVGEPGEVAPPLGAVAGAPLLVGEVREAPPLRHWREGDIGDFGVKGLSSKS